MCFLFLTDMRRDVQEIFRLTPHEKQVMMFSATLSKEIRPVCRKFMQDVSYQDLLMCKPSFGSILSSLIGRDERSCELTVFYNVNSILFTVKAIFMLMKIDTSLWYGQIYFQLEWMAF